MDKQVFVLEFSKEDKAELKVINELLSLDFDNSECFLLEVKHINSIQGEVKRYGLSDDLVELVIEYCKERKKELEECY